MRKVLIDNEAQNLIVFFAGWGCDEKQFVNLKDAKSNVLILFDYQNLELNFDFAKYNKMSLIAYSAGVFVASIMGNKLPRFEKKIAVCGNPYLFDEKWGLNKKTVEMLEKIDLNNYLDFRREYMVETDEEYEEYNRLQSLRSIESCQQELDKLKYFYETNKSKIKSEFDGVLLAENDRLFRLEAQLEFYKNKAKVIPMTRHHIFFMFTSFEQMFRYF